MKKKLTTFAIFGTLLLSSFAFISLKENVAKVDAAIDIKDYTACNTAHNNNDASKLLSALRTITGPGKAGSYDQLWQTYKTCYVRTDGKIFDYYSNATNYVPGGKAEGANYDEEGDSYNREHSIPKSWWGGAKTNQGADPYIVVPTDGYVNNRRGNNPFGMVGSVTYSSKNGFCKLGTGKSEWGYSGTVFEPDDSLKGDFARIQFYAIAKYSGSYNWTTSEGSTCFSGSASKNFGLTDYSVKLFSYWSHIDPVSEWEMSVNEKVSAIQKNRNPFIDHPEYADTLWGNVSGYTKYEEEPDPDTLESIAISNEKTDYYVGDEFVKPTVTAIYTGNIKRDVTNKAEFSGFDSSAVGSNTITVTYSNKSTSYTVTISEKPVALALTVSPTSISIKVQETAQITYSTNKEDARVSWSISDPLMAILEEGENSSIKVTAIKEGTATITVSATIGSESVQKTISLTVSNTPTPTPAPSNGCRGNVATTSIVLSSLALAGIIALIIVSISRKKKTISK